MGGYLECFIFLEELCAFNKGIFIQAHLRSTMGRNWVIQIVPPLFKVLQY